MTPIIILVTTKTPAVITKTPAVVTKTPAVVTETSVVVTETPMVITETSVVVSEMVPANSGFAFLAGWRSVIFRLDGKFTV